MPKREPQPVRHEKWEKESQRDGERHKYAFGESDRILAVAMLELRQRQHQHGRKRKGDDEPGDAWKTPREPSREPNDAGRHEDVEDGCHNTFHALPN